MNYWKCDYRKTTVTVYIDMIKNTCDVWGVFLLSATSSLGPLHAEGLVDPKSLYRVFPIKFRVGMIF
jgi:hypothetical protein